MKLTEVAIADFVVAAALVSDVVVLQLVLFAVGKSYSLSPETPWLGHAPETPIFNIINIAIFLMALSSLHRAKIFQIFKKFLCKTSKILLHISFN